MIGFNVGDGVKWRSQANGSETEKLGTVVYVMVSGLTYYPAKIAQRSFSGHTRMFDGLKPPFSKDYGRAYLVSVSDGHRKPKLYMPRPSNLESQ